jgi:hypothetical protein
LPQITSIKQFAIVYRAHVGEKKSTPLIYSQNANNMIIKTLKEKNVVHIKACKGSFLVFLNKDGPAVCILFSLKLQ